MTSMISVAMSIYKSDVPEYLSTAIESVYNQTLKPSEIVIVGDGPIPSALGQVVAEQTEKARANGVELRFLPQEINRGLGEALRICCENCRYLFVARMDSDDISLPDRFDKQIAAFENDPTLSVVGGMITEFVGTPDHIVDERRLPLDDRGIKKFMASRCGVNHVTVMFRKSELMKAGNYSGKYRQEDFYLWARMWKNDCKFGNIKDVVVNVRSGADQFARRGGMKYFHEHMKIFKLMYQWGLITYPQLMKNYCLRFAQVAFPTSLRTWVYQNMLRK